VLDATGVATILARGFRGIAKLREHWHAPVGLGLLYRVRDVFRAAGALVCLGRWLHRVPT
jgi:hypothetical protein